MYELPELIVDCFCGAGGASIGIKAACGRSPDIAIDFEPHAVYTHHVNNPGTLHLCSDIRKIDPSSVCAGRSVGLLWASPDCTHFSPARGHKPVDESIRGLAWVVVKWAKEVSPRVIILENVPEFDQWGPLDAQGHPDKGHAGETFMAWVAELRECGYDVEWRVLCASNHGVPTARKRLFAIARNDKKSVCWPEPGDETTVNAAQCIDWEDIGAVVGSNRAEKTLTRFAKGTLRYVTGPTADPYIVKRDGKVFAAWLAKHYGSGVGISVRRPLATITKNDHHGLVMVELLPCHSGTVSVDGSKYTVGDTYHRMLKPSELRVGMGFPANYKLPGGIGRQNARIGSAVCPPLAEALVRANYA